MRSKSLFQVIIVIFISVIFISMTMFSCSKTDERRKITIIVDNQVTGFFCLKQDATGAVPTMDKEKGSIVYAVKSVTELVSDTTHFGKWHVLSAERPNGKAIPVFPQKGADDKDPICYGLSAQSDGTIFFLIGSPSEKLIYESINSLKTIEELNRMINR